MTGETSNSFKDKLKAWGKFFISAYFIKNFCIWLAAVVLFFLIVIFSLKIYTRHTQKVSVPSVEGLSITEAEKIISSRKLIPVVSDSVYNSSAAAGTIIPNGQIPRAGYTVKEGRKVFLTYKAWTKEPAKMPSVVGISLSDAQMQLQQSGLLLGKITKKKGKYANLVLEARFNGAKISAGKDLFKGDVIDLTVSDGEEDNDSATDSYSDDSGEDTNNVLDNGIDEF